VEPLARCWRPLWGTSAGSAIPERCEPQALAAPTCRGIALMAPSAAPRRADCDTTGVLGLTSFEGLDDPHVAHHDGEGVHERVLGPTEQAAPARADPPDGGVGQRGIRALRRGAPGLRGAVLWPGVVVLLTGLLVHLRLDGDAHLGATTQKFFRRVRHARAAQRPGQRSCLVRAADLAGGSRDR
jgi:hypothetical protein